MIKFSSSYEFTTPNTSNSLEIQQVTTPRPPVMTQKEINENKAEKNMFFMALTMCSISLVSRVLILVGAAFFVYFD